MWHHLLSPRQSIPHPTALCEDSGNALWRVRWSAATPKSRADGSTRRCPDDVLTQMAHGQSGAARPETCPTSAIGSGHCGPGCAVSCETHRPRHGSRRHHGELSPALHRLRAPCDSERGVPHLSSTQEGTRRRSSEPRKWGTDVEAAVRRSESARARGRGQSVQADLSCLMCGRLVGHLIGNRVVHRAGCTGQIKIDHGMLRCCQCNGTLYREPVSPLLGR
jgi:hypothetical protein